MTRHAVQKHLHFGLQDLPTPTDHHEWYANAVRAGEQKLRLRGVYADDRIFVLKPLGHEIFEDGTTVYAHLRRATTIANRAYTLSELDACIRARIVIVAHEAAR